MSWFIVIQWFVSQDQKISIISSIPCQVDWNSISFAVNSIFLLRMIAFLNENQPQLPTKYRCHKFSDNEKLFRANILIHCYKQSLWNWVNKNAPDDTSIHTGLHYINQIEDEWEILEFCWPLDLIQFVLTPAWIRFRDFLHQFINFNNMRQSDALTRFIPISVFERCTICIGFWCICLFSWSNSHGIPILNGFIEWLPIGANTHQSNSVNLCKFRTHYIQSMFEPMLGKWTQIESR